MRWMALVLAVGCGGTVATPDDQSSPAMMAPIPAPAPSARYCILQPTGDGYSCKSDGVDCTACPASCTVSGSVGSCL